MRVYISPPGAARAPLTRLKSPPTPRASRHTGQCLIDQFLLTEDQRRIAVLEQMKSHLPVGRLLVQLGFVSEATLRDALSEKLGLQSVDLTRIIVDPSALKMLPRELARRYRIPCYSSAGVGDAKVPGMQALYEKMLTHTYMAMTGAQYIHYAFGLLDRTNTFSPLQAVLARRVVEQSR